MNSHHSPSNYPIHRPLSCIGVRRPSLRIALSLVAAAFVAVPPPFVVLAGDILRGGSAAAPSHNASPETGNPPAAATLASVSGRDSLARTTQALQAVQAMQAAARAAAMNGGNNPGSNPNLSLPNVPNGLTAGGLQVAPGVPGNLPKPGPGEDPTLWSGANLPTQAISNGTTDVSIVQTAQQALLNWRTFNIGKETKLTFDQTGGGVNASQWIAFNKVNDPSGVPSQILGSLDAIGQIYVINANGIIFGGSSQINVHTLVASALPINDNLISRGLLNNPDNQFLFSALPLPAGSNGTPAFTPPPSNTVDSHYGNIVVQAGATITSPTSADHVGGRVALLGANVTNEGTISTPDGQTILAAGLQVGLAAHATSDPSLRGLDVFVGQVGTYAGQATNAGLIDAARADVTIAGKDVNQLGFINSSTSVSLNGRIDLLAEYNAISDDPKNTAANPPPFLFQSTGNVEFGPNSVTQVLPELFSSERVVGTQLALMSQVNVQGLAIHEASDAIISAPSGNVALTAGNWISFIESNFPASRLISSSGQIYLDSGATIDVSGSQNVSASVAENIIAAQLLGPELANFPLQRNGPLRGKTIYIDIRNRGNYNGQDWVGTPLADVSGYVNLVQRTVGELTTAGGTVSLSAGESVVMQPGSSINVSGGSVNYTGAQVRTTQVVSDGHIFDISQATPDRIYSGILGGFTTIHPKWGVVETFATVLPSTSRFEPGYIQGENGGSLSIVAPSMALDGRLLGNTIAGPQQRTAPPTPSALSLVFQAQDPTPTAFLPFSPTPPLVIFQSSSGLAAAAPFALDSAGNPLPLRADRKEQVVLSPDLLNVDGFGILKIDDSDGNISVPADIQLTTPVRGSIALSGANIDVEGKLISPGGSLTFNVYDISPTTVAQLNRGTILTIPPADPSRGHFFLGTGAFLDAAGMITDDRPNSVLPVNATYTANGGTIAINSYSSDLAAGSVISVSGGVTVSGSGQLAYGAAGTLVIKAGQDPNVAAVLDGKLTLAAELQGYSGANGGSLSILAPSIQVGGATSNSDTLLLAPNFLNQGGFTSFTLSGLGAPTGHPDQYLPAVVIASDTTIAPVAQSVLVHLDANGPGTLTLAPALLPQGLRTPFSISFRAPGVKNPINNLPIVRGDFVMEAGASIQTDPRGSVSISGDTAAVLGSIVVPGGTISISGGGNTTDVFPTEQSRALPTVDLGPASFLSTAGVTLLTLNSLGLRNGTVLDGGKIIVSGNIVAENGSKLDVSGATGTLDLLPGFGGSTSSASLTGQQFVPTQVDSNGGSITLKGGQELFTDATFEGAAGGPSAMGGSLSISSGRFFEGQQLPTDATMLVTQSDLTIPASFYGAGQDAIGHAVVGSGGQTILGQGYFAANKFNQSGLDSLSLQSAPFVGKVQFSGPVTITAGNRINVANGGVIDANGAVSLNAPYVQIGSSFQNPLQPQQIVSPFLLGSAPFNFLPTFGAGSLSVTAKLIDIGNLSTQNIGNVNLVANNGDIRGDGTFDVAGHLSITAAQIYPPTAVGFTLAAYDYTPPHEALHQGSITLAASGSRQLPFSAGGQLNLYSSIINDGGVLRAPIGTINIGWNGNGAAPIDLITGQQVPVAQQVALRPGSVTSVSAVDPVSGKTVTIPYGFNLNGTSWIDPTGIDITSGGVPPKSINISGTNIVNQAGSTIDLRGGGDLYAYQFVPGTGGTNDVLGSSTTFAIIPNYQTEYAPFAPYNPIATTVFGNDQGYVTGKLNVGDGVFLNASRGLPSGMYTLLPARYALLPGAFLITPKAGVPTATFVQPDGSSLVSGYRFNGFTPPVTQPVFSSFEVASQSVVRQRAPYNNFSANKFLNDGAAAHGGQVPPLPIDSGHLLFDAAQSLDIRGTLAGQAPAGGRGGQVDISSPLDILITNPNVTSAGNFLVLNSTELSSFGAESLLIGGIRQNTATGTSIAVKTDNITVANSGAPLSAPDLILVANKDLVVVSGSDIEASGSISSATPLSIGTSSTPGSGDGVLLRVSAAPTAQVSRFGVDSTATVPNEVIEANARIAGASVTLDSTYATNLSPTAAITGRSVNLDSGQISIQLPNGTVTQPTAGLVLAGVALQNVESVQSLSLLSYSSIDIYGSGTINSSNNLQLHAGEMRGFSNGATVDFVAKEIVLDNSANGSAPGSVAPATGALQFDSNTIEIGANQLKVDQFANISLNTTNGLLLGSVGELDIQGNLTVTAPVIAGRQGATQVVSATGAVQLKSPTLPSGTSVTSGIGASLTISGSSLAADTNISAPSGQIALHATNGDLAIGSISASNLDVSGTARTFYDLVKYTDGGQINLIADHGSVNVAANSTVNVAAQPAGGNAGTLVVAAPAGTFTINGTMSAASGANGTGGNFSLDIGSLPALAGLDAQLNAASFSQSRSIRVRTGNVLVDGEAIAKSFNLSADQGSIAVTGTIDASGNYGGVIDLVASGSVVLQPGSLLSVVGQNFDHAGKGGSVSLEAGSETNGTFDPNAVVDIQSGSTIDLSVVSNNGASASLGEFTGSLHLRAPQTSGSTDVRINPINGTIVNVSSIVVEGYEIFNATDGSINNQTSAVFANGTTFAGNSATISSRLLAHNQSLAPVTVIVPGAEIINLSGNLALGAPDSIPASGDWDLSTYRFGPNNVPGVLTLRAAGNLVFYNALSDGFTSSPDSSVAYNAVLLPQNTSLPANVQSWSYRLVAGADFNAADFHGVQALSILDASSGSVQLGKDYGLNVFVPSGPNALTSNAVSTNYQVIRTGTGNIDVVAGRDIQLLNQFATIYTAGTQVADPALGGTFDFPNTDAIGQRGGALGAIQQTPAYPAQYSFAGGNVTLTAQRDIIHQTRNAAGVLVEDSSRELPVNWLYRRGFVDPATGLFGVVVRNGASDIGSTTWWTDFSNFFEGIGALGGGNVTITSGHDVSNIDAVVPTNARMPGKDSSGNPIAPNLAKLVELGGGDVVVHAENDINGGVYYVERGAGTLDARNSILTNGTRTPSSAAITSLADTLPETTWLPTTLFLGKGSFDVRAGGDLLLGPVANPFLLPEGINNSFWYKTYFSTYASTDAVNVVSLTGSVTLRESTTLPGGQGSSAPILQGWLANISLLNTNPQTLSVSFYQPWLRLNETSVDPVATLVSLLPSTLRATAMSGDVNVVGNLNLFPAPQGTLDILAKGAVNGVHINGFLNQTTWGASTINLSDADPNRVPGIISPFAFRTVLGDPSSSGLNRVTGDLFLTFINNVFAETGSTQGSASVLQTKQTLHASGLLHANDPNPIHIYAGNGDISGFTLFSGKAARVASGRDITDVGFYIQNVKSSDLSVIAAGRDLIAYDPNSVLRAAAQSPGNALNTNATPATGDIQISGPGTLEVLAGRNLDLGVGPNNPDGTAVGITSIGNARNPSLPFQGADVTAAAGIGGASTLANSKLDFATFISRFLDPTAGGAEAARYLPELGKLLGLASQSNSSIWEEFRQLPEEKQDAFALDIFYLVLRDAGRDHNNPSSPNFGSYKNGYAALHAIFPATTQWQGDISLTSREIKTLNGGDINLLAPGGQLNVGVNVTGAQAADQGILTEHGGNIAIFTDRSVNVGTSRIFTLRGGNEIIWSTNGDIAAGSSSKTVLAAPPTRVLIDPQSGDVRTDLAGLATGGGIGVLETVAGVPPSDVDLVAPTGTVNAGDAGIRVSGNLNIAAVLVLNAGNIQVGGTSAGVPTAAVPNIGNLTSASNTIGAANNAAEQSTGQNRPSTAQEDIPSIISVEVIGYGGSDDNSNDQDEERNKGRAQELQRL